ncbi:hypothetical protein D3C72_2000140 [compost metagenome]
MEKEKWHIILKIMSLLLILGFLIRLISDYYQIKIGNNSFPFYGFVIERVLEFLIPSLIIFVSAKYFENKYNKKEE